MESMVLPDGRTFGDIRLSRLTWQDIEHLYAAMRASGRGPEWIRRCATVLTRALDLARKRGLIDANPSKDAVRPKSVRKKPFSPAEADVRELLAAVADRDPELADIITVMASSGIRHYVATAMLDAGESYRTVAGILGNSEATLRLHYDGRTGIEKRKAIGALELQKN